MKRFAFLSVALIGLFVSAGYSDSGEIKATSFQEAKLSVPSYQISDSVSFDVAKTAFDVETLGIFVLANVDLGAPAEANTFLTALSSETHLATVRGPPRWCLKS